MYYHIFNEDWWDTLDDSWKEVFILSIRKSSCRDKFEAITRLDTIMAPNKNLRTLEPLKELKNLKFLYLAYNYIYDLRPLSNLPKLYSLNITSNEVSDLSPLRNCLNLVELKCQFNRITTIEPVLNLPNLTNLIFDDRGNSVRKRRNKESLYESLPSLISV